MAESGTDIHGKTMSSDVHDSPDSNKDNEASVSPEEQNENSTKPVYIYKLAEHSLAVIKTLDEYRQNTEYCDAVITTIDKETIRAHSLILTACSTYFKRRFLSGSDIYIPAPHWALKKIIEFLYTGEVSVVADEVLELKKTSETVMVNGLTDICLDYMKTHNIPNYTDPNDTIPTGYADDRDDYKTPIPARHAGGKYSVRSHPYPWACPHCKYRTVSKSRIEEHIQNHSGNLPLKCAVCTYSSATNQGLTKHITSSHTRNELDQLNKRGNYKFMYADQTPIIVNQRPSPRAKCEIARLQKPNHNVGQEENTPPSSDVLLRTTPLNTNNIQQNIKVPQVDIASLEINGSSFQPGSFIIVNDEISETAHHTESGKLSMTQSVKQRQLPIIQQLLSNTHRPQFSVTKIQQSVTPDIIKTQTLTPTKPMTEESADVTQDITTPQTIVNEMQHATCTSPETIVNTTQELIIQSEQQSVDMTPQSIITRQDQHLITEQPLEQSAPDDPNDICVVGNVTGKEQLIVSETGEELKIIDLSQL